MPNNLTLIIPSRGRIESLRRCVNSALAYASGDVKVIVFFDGTDHDNCFEAYSPPPNCIKRIGSYAYAYYVWMMNEALEAILDRNDPQKPSLYDMKIDLFVTANNDQEFFMPGWDRIAIEALYAKFDDGMGVVEIGDHEGLSFNTFISRVKFWDEHYDGQLFDPRFKQYFADADRMKDLEKNGWFGRLAPGLVQTYNCFDEVKHEGLKHWFDDKAAFEEKHA